MMESAGAGGQVAQGVRVCVGVYVCVKPSPGKQQGGVAGKLHAHLRHAHTRARTHTHTHTHLFEELLTVQAAQQLHLHLLALES